MDFYLLIGISISSLTNIFGHRITIRIYGKNIIWSRSAPLTCYIEPITHMKLHYKLSNASAIFYDYKFNIKLYIFISSIQNEYLKIKVEIPLHVLVGLT